MKTTQLFRIISIIIILLTGISCSKEENENFTFSVSGENGGALSGTQVLSYDQTKLYPVTFSDVSKVVFETPEGWSAQMLASEKKIKITSPSADAVKADEKGTVKVTATSYNSKKITVSIDVQVKDADISFALDGLESELKVKYAQTLEFTATAANVWSIDYTAPKGWEVSFDQSTMKLKITAPGIKNTEAEKDGSVTIVPKSKKGNKGQQISFNVSILASMPVLSFGENKLERVAHSSENVLTSTEYANVQTIEVKSFPKGWTVEARTSLADAKLVVKAPAIGASDYSGSGKIVLSVLSDTQEQASAEVTVSLLGINDAADFLAFADAYTKGTDCSSWTDAGQIVLNADVDITNSPKSLYVNRDFSGVFNGDGHTVKYKITATSGDAGLFQTLEKDATIKNLTLAGSFDITDGVSCAGGLTSYSKGASFENIVTKVTYKETGSGRGGMLGGLVGDETNTGKYVNCHNRGKMSVVAVQFLGGLISDVWDNFGAEMYDSSNEADIEIIMNGIKMGNSWFGGLIGKSDGSGFKIYRSFNSGNITFDFGGKNSNLAGLGGLAGYASGYYEDCYNLGNITDVNKDDITGSARIGGLAGCVVKAKGLMLEAVRCYNKGKVTAMGEGVGGLIGIIKDGDKGTMKLTGCYNEGIVDCRNPKSSVQSFGGIVGTVYNYLEMKDCSNSALVMGYTSVGGAGLIGRGADHVTISGCSNSGNVYVGAHSDAIGNYPLAAGLVCGVYPTTTITNSKNTGKIFAMVQKEACASKTFVSDRILSGASDDSSVDADTEKNSASSVVTLILKGSWTDTMPVSWVK